MAATSVPPLSLSIFLLIFFFFPMFDLNSAAHGHTKSPTTSPYLSPTTLFPDYQKMITSFRIYVYHLPDSFTFTTQPFSLFQSSLLNSPFITHNPNEAHLFFVQFSPDLSTRSLARLIKDLRINHPYWNRTLGADHFFLSPAACVDYSPDRNVLELKKNSVQISLFPTTSGFFIPHKDIALPPLNPNPLQLPHAPTTNNATASTSFSFLGYMRWDGEAEPSLVNELLNDPDFVIVSEPSDDNRRAGDSKFCLFLYGSDIDWMVDAMAAGCVPVLILGHPIQDLPLIDVLKWAEIAVLVGARGGVHGLKSSLAGIGDKQYENMRGSGVLASRHLVWNVPVQPYDAFHMVMYQLWLRRHTIRYARRE